MPIEQHGGYGDDKIDGAKSNMRDRADFSDHAEGMTVDLAAGTESRPGELDELKNVQEVDGAQGDDTLPGNAWTNRMAGLGGHDRCTQGPFDQCLP